MLYCRVLTAFAVLLHCWIFVRRHQHQHDFMVKFLKGIFLNSEHSCDQSLEIADLPMHLQKIKHGKKSNTLMFSYFHYICFFLVLLLLLFSLNCVCVRTQISIKLMLSNQSMGSWRENECVWERARNQTNTNKCLAAKMFVIEHVIL